MYKKILREEQKQYKDFQDKGVVPGDLKRYKEYLQTRHHHEILPERLYLIRRIMKSKELGEKQLYIQRYNVLEEMHPNKSWKEFVNDLEL